MKNHSNTQERSPKLIESNPSIRRRQNKLQLLTNHPWLLVVGVGALLMAIAAVAILSLTHTGRIEKDSTKQTTTFNQKTPITTNRNPNSSPNWLLTIVLLSGGAASAVAIYKWRRHLPTIAKRELTRRQQRKLLLQQGKKTTTPLITKEITLENNSSSSNLKTVSEVILEDTPVEPILMDVTPTIALLPPEETQPSDLGSQSLAEMMDIRKHLSLAAILQDFRRKE